MQTPSKQVGKDRLKLQYLLPNDTRKTLIESKAIDYCLHIGLLITRYLPFEAVDNTAYQRENKGRAVDDGTWKGEWLSQAAQQINAAYAEGEKLYRLAEATYRRWEALTHDAQRFTMENQGRLLIGLGGESVLETGLTVQHLTGLPYVPGSALKGLCRTYALMLIGDKARVPLLTGEKLIEHQKKEKDQNKSIDTPLQILDKWMTEAGPDKRKTLLDELEKRLGELGFDPSQITENDYDHEIIRAYREIFGSQDLGGACVFYDGVLSKLPAAPSLFELDVMTPHFPEYYTNEGKKPPTDDQNPNPINFLTVAAGCEFAFAVGLRSQKADRHDLREQASTWLRLALHELGVGAKTASGYGVFYRHRDL